MENRAEEQLRLIHCTLVKAFDGSIRCAEKVPTCTTEEVFGMEKHIAFLEAAEEDWGVAFEGMMRAVGDKCLG